MEVYPVGTIVDLGGTHALITCIMIRSPTHASYECVWWNGHERKELWVSSVEIKCVVEGQEKTKIGFK